MYIGTLKLFFLHFFIPIFLMGWSEPITPSNESKSSLLLSLDPMAKKVSRKIKWIRIKDGKFLMGSTQKEIQTVYKEARLRSSMLDKHIFSAESPSKRFEILRFKYLLTSILL